MKKVVKFWKVVLYDTLAVICMAGALATGWLPGPGGIPLFLIGLGLLSVHHKWAERYIDLLQEYADRLGDLIFVKNPRVQLLYDIVAPLMVANGIRLLIIQGELWTVSFGISQIFLGITLFLGNRGRWGKIRQLFKRKR